MEKEAIYKAAYSSILDIDEDMALKAVEDAKQLNLNLMDLLGNGFGAGMQELGELFGKGKVFLPEVMFAADIMKKASEIIEETLPDADTNKKGVYVIGTVAGDVHDIGKGIVCALVKTNGFEVHDLGREVPARDFIDTAEKVGADFIASSALLTTTMPEQKKIEELLRKEGLRDKYKTMVGGAPTTKRWADRIGADAYCEDAAETVRILNEWISNA